jgi:hypothetical protein
MLTYASWGRQIYLFLWLCTVCLSIWPALSSVCIVPVFLWLVLSSIWPVLSSIWLVYGSLLYLYCSSRIVTYLYCSSRISIARYYMSLHLHDLVSVFLYLCISVFLCLVSYPYGLVTMDSSLWMHSSLSSLGWALSRPWVGPVYMYIRISVWLDTERASGHTWASATDSKQKAPAGWHQIITSCRKQAAAT